MICQDMPLLDGFAITNPASLYVGANLEDDDVDINEEVLQDRSSIHNDDR